MNEIIDSLKITFNQGDFPHLSEVELSEYKPPMEGHQTTVTLKAYEGDWKHLSALESDIKDYIAEGNLIREIYVGRHTVKGLDPEVILSSTDATTDKGHNFLAELAGHLGQQERRPAVVTREPVGVAAGAAPEQKLFVQPSFATAPKPKVVDPSELYKQALASLIETALALKPFDGLSQTTTGLMALVDFPAKGFLGRGGHFGPEQEQVLKNAYRSVRAMSGYGSGWAAFYHYDKNSRVLSVKTDGENEQPPAGWQTLR